MPVGILRGLFLSIGEGIAVAYPDNFGYQAIYNGGTDLLEDIAVKIVPAVTVGQFTVSLPIKFELYGTTYGGYQLRQDPVYIIDVEPTIKWSPAAGITVKALIGIDLINTSVGDFNTDIGIGFVDQGHTSGETGFGIDDIFGQLQVAASFGISSE